MDRQVFQVTTFEHTLEYGPGERLSFGYERLVEGWDDCVWDGW